MIGGKRRCTATPPVQLHLRWFLDLRHEVATHRRGPTSWACFEKEAKPLHLCPSPLASLCPACQFQMLQFGFHFISAAGCLNKVLCEPCGGRWGLNGGNQWPTQLLSLVFCPSRNKRIGTHAAKRRDMSEMAAVACLTHRLWMPSRELVPFLCADGPWDRAGNEPGEHPS